MAVFEGDSWESLIHITLGSFGSQGTWGKGCNSKFWERNPKEKGGKKVASLSHSHSFTLGSKKGKRRGEKPAATTTIFEGWVWAPRRGKIVQEEGEEETTSFTLVFDFYFLYFLLVFWIPLGYLSWNSWLNLLSLFALISWWTKLVLVRDAKEP